MAKKTYAPYEGQSYATALPGGKALRVDIGETYETADEDEQRELDALAARPNSGVKDVTKKGKGD